ncbi:PREDICTED: uncharacterized protein LOC109206635 [Nicotiana attenuata]|uniref:uncharacterized protein LOC109206635 n=1 Tax=Nicotiana attenuata TaxID=49451 RepID=UPI0009048C40|nr:PREDICTED: uncharacterized protein LOC109206635 [Nicotiana attenuata]
MEGESVFSSIAPPVFDGENYQVWAVRMEAYMDACGLWEAVEEDYEVFPLPCNPTMTQIKTHKEKKTRKSKAKACLYAALSPTIFSRIMTLNSAKAIWDFLEKEYYGDERIRGMKVLNLEYSDRLINLENKVKLLGTELSDKRIGQKILVTLPEKFRATIASLENTKDLSNISLAELLNSLQAQEQRRLMRNEGDVEGALQARQLFNPCSKGKKQKGKKSYSTSTEVVATDNSNNNKGGKYPPCQHCRKRNHPHFKCWRKPDMRCRKCHKLGHAEIICKEKGPQQSNEAQIAEQQEEEC